jgi:hypothetical protein
MQYWSSLEFWLFYVSRRRVEHTVFPYGGYGWGFPVGYQVQKDRAIRGKPQNFD